MVNGFQKKKVLKDKRKSIPNVSILSHIIIFIEEKITATRNISES